MKIVTEVGVIGLAQLFETARTGIYRVITSLTCELLARDDIDINFTSLSSLQVNQLVDHYLFAKNFGQRAFPRNKIEHILTTLAGCDSEKPQESLYGKVLSKLYRISLTGRIGEQADLFHSQFAPLPKFTGSSSPVRMLTIYDIIPLIHPEYFEEGFIVDDFKPITESFLPQKDYIFTISECSKNDICTCFKMDPARVFVIPLAASPELYYPVQDDTLINEVKKSFGIPRGKYFLTLATVEKRKNLALSISCFREVLKETRREDLYFVLVGTRGWKIDDVMNEIENDSILQNKVIFTGFVPDEHLSALYSGAVAFLYPSLYEGFGLPPLEAMQCGLPVIASNSSSLPEVVGDAGILIDPHDKDSMCEAMLNIIEDESLHAHYVIQGLERASEFSWKRCADKTVAGYQTAWQNR